jgi:type II secretory pathway pseudopilin PulG
MSYFYSTNRCYPCQRGFLLLEALVTLCALGILMVSIASWYSNAIRMQRTIAETGKAMAALNSYSELLQSSHQVPAATVMYEGYQLQTQTTPDVVVHDFYWVTMRIIRSENDEVLAQVQTGVYARGSS